MLLCMTTPKQVPLSSTEIWAQIYTQTPLLGCPVNCEFTWIYASHFVGIYLRQQKECHDLERRDKILAQVIATRIEPFHPPPLPAPKLPLSLPMPMPLLPTWSQPFSHPPVPPPMEASETSTACKTPLPVCEHNPEVCDSGPV